MLLQNEPCFCITRYGKVKMTSSHPNQCKAVGHKTFNYVVKIIVHKDNLNEQGFVVDHNNINKTVESVFEDYAASCEDMALITAEQLKKLCEEEKVEPIGLYIKITPYTKNPTAAHMEYASSSQMMMLSN